MDRLDELFERQLSGETTPEEQREIVEHLRDPAASLHWGRQMRLVGRIAAGRRRRHPLRLAAWIAAAACIAVGALLLAWPADAAAGWPRVEAIGPGATVDGAPAAVGMGIAPGQVAGGAMTLRLADASTLETAAGSALTPLADGHGARLLAGSVGVAAAPQRPGRSLRISAPRTETEVHGTRFTVATTADGDLVTVAEGAVAVSDRNGNAVRLSPGEAARGDGVRLSSGRLPAPGWRAALAPAPAGWKGRQVEHGLMALFDTRVKDAVDMFAIYGADVPAPGLARLGSDLVVELGYDVPADTTAYVQLKVIGALSRDDFRGNMQAEIVFAAGQDRTLKVPWREFALVTPEAPLAHGLQGDEAVGRLLLLLAFADKGVVLRWVGLGRGD